MDAKSGIQISLVLRIVDGIHKVLDGNLIITVPNKTGNIILKEIGTRIIGYIPTTSEILWKTSDIVAISIHQTIITVCLQQRSCQLCIRIQLVHLGLIGVNAFHHAVRARSHHTASSHQQESHCETAFAYIFLDYIIHFIVVF